MPDKETLGMIIGLCTIGLIYFGRLRVDDAARRDAMPKFKWGDAQRREEKSAWWAGDLFLCVLTFLVVSFIHVMMR